MAGDFELVCDSGEIEMILFKSGVYDFAFVVGHNVVERITGDFRAVAFSQLSFDEEIWEAFGLNFAGTRG